MQFSRSPAPTISAKGFGDADPVASNDTPQDSPQNRRVELSVSLRAAEISASPLTLVVKMLPGINNQTGLHRRGNPTPGQGASAKSLAHSPGV
jgi:hypothetical protein